MTVRGRVRGADECGERLGRLREVVEVEERRMWGECVWGEGAESVETRVRVYVKSPLPRS